MNTSRWSDDQVEQIIGGLLRGGVLLAAAVALAGGVFLWLRHGGETASFGTFRGESAEFRSIASAVRGALALDSRAIVQLGLILLIATPVARVVLSLVAFLLQRDRLYVLITAIVLAVLVFSLVFGGG